MSVIVLVRFEGDAELMERTAQQNVDLVTKIVNNGRETYGCIHHQFIDGGAQFCALDEWPSQDAFERFFDANGDDIRLLMGKAGVTSEPTIEIWGRLETPDRF